MFRDWLLIDELRLGLEMALVSFPGEGSHRPDLIAGLRQTRGVRQIIETQRDRDVIAVVVFLDVQHRRDLRARLEELAPRLRWDDVLFETHEPSILLWQELALRVAEKEGLLAS